MNPQTFNNRPQALAETGTLPRGLALETLLERANPGLV